MTLIINKYQIKWAGLTIIMTKKIKMKYLNNFHLIENKILISELRYSIWKMKFNKKKRNYKNKESYQNIHKYH
jgi:hypothetical protein